MNDPDTLGFYTTLQLFRNNPEAAAGAILQFPSALSPQQRRIVHSLAIKLNLDSYVIDQNYIIISVSYKSTSLQHPCQQDQSDSFESYDPLSTNRASIEYFSPRNDLRTSRSLTNLGNNAM
jgi:hypothetical protein